MILAMQQSVGDTIVRAVVMGAVLGGAVWAANRYTTIPRLVIQRVIQWYETSSVTSRGNGVNRPGQRSGRGFFYSFDRTADRCASAGVRYAGGRAGNAE